MSFFFHETEEERVTPTTNHWSWQRLSPHNLDHRQRLPTAITLHRLVPRPPPVLHQADTASSSTFKYITPEEIKIAQIKARQEIQAAKQVPQASPPLPPSSDSKVPSSSKSKRHSHHRKEIPVCRPFSSCHPDSGEAGMRRRQLTRLLTQISQTVADLQNLKNSHQKDFITPLDLEVKKRRWVEYVRSMRRSLFTLKQEVGLLEGKHGQGRKCSRYLRTLAATARTLNIQLMALKSQAEFSGGEVPWTEVFREFSCVARRVLVLTVRIGVQLPPSSLKWARLSEEGVSPAPDEGSGLESVMSLLDANSTSVPLLQSKHVRNRLASLARLHLKKKSKKNECKTTTGSLANNDPTCKPMPSLPTTSSQASQTFRTQVPPEPQSTPLQTKTSPMQPQSSLPHSNASAGQTQISPSQSNVSSPHRQPLPPQSDNTEAPYPPSSPHERNSQVPPADLTQQLVFLLQRVCKMEDNKRRSEALISEAPQTCQSTTPSLNCVVQRAKLALATVRSGEPYSQVPPPISGGSDTLNVPLIRSSGFTIKNSGEDLVGSSSNPAEHGHNVEEVVQTVDHFGIQWLAGGSVTDQVRQLKEKFWLSLAEQGFVRPPENLSPTEEKVNVKEFDNWASNERTREEFASTLRKTAIPDASSKRNAASKIELQKQTPRFRTKQSYSSSVSVSSSHSSHSSNNTNSRTQHSSSEKHSKSSIAADSGSKHSLLSERQLQHSTSTDSNTSTKTESNNESQSFPSYEGISSSNDC